ncbi:MAG: hypothetical protein GXZ18_02625 [Synergistaceae bacterium]|nr:hypothetical protein [Synergistaceae bacterium]
MALVRSTTLRCLIIFLCLVLGTWVGIFLQQYSSTAPLFTNIVDFVIDINKIDLLMIKIGFLFAVKLNLGTVIGGIIGIWAIR